MHTSAYFRRCKPLGGALVLGALLAQATACTQQSTPPNLVGQDVHLTIVHTADLHSRFFPYQYAPSQIDKSLGLVPSQGNIAVVGGIGRVATVVKKIRSESERTIHLDSGDMFEGAPVYNTYAGEVEMKAMTRLGVNAMALGNHEFDKGAQTLELMKEKFGGFPILAANYLFADPTDPTQPKLRNVIQPFTIMNAGGLTIGVIGLGNLSSLQGIYEGGNSLGIRPVDTLSAIQDTVRLLRPQVDLLIMVTHLGLDVDEALAQQNNSIQCGNCMSDADCRPANMACADPNNCPSCDVSKNRCFNCVVDQNSMAAIEGVDVIFGGHLHIVLDPPNRIDHPDGTYTVVCHSGAFAKFVGRLDLEVHIGSPDAVGPDNKPDLLARKNHVKSYTYTLKPIDDTIQSDPDMDNMLEPYQIAMNLRLNLGEKYAVIPCPQTASTCPKVQRNDSNGGDSQLGNLVATSMRLRKRVEADFGLTNSLGIRADFESGALNLEEMYNVFPFDNTITTMFLSGTEITEMLDFLAERASERGCRSQAQVSGIWYVADCSNHVACGPFDANGQQALRCHASDRNLNVTAPFCAPGAKDDDITCRHDGPALLGDRCLALCAPGSSEPCPCRQILPFGSYRVAVNDYIANGGSGFSVLKRNTTKFNTGISLRDALVDYIRTIPKRCLASDYPTLVGPMDPNTMRPTYDFTTLPCIQPDGSNADGTIDLNAAPHDGRINMVSP